jgi:hypothetical protein
MIFSVTFSRIVVPKSTTLLPSQDTGTGNSLNSSLCESGTVRISKKITFNYRYSTVRYRSVPEHILPDKIPYSCPASILISRNNKQKPYGTLLMNKVLKEGRYEKVRSKRYTLTCKRRQARRKNYQYKQTSNTAQPYLIKPSG